ncbi:MAG: hypothetical protein JWM28_1150 [Chitinophagaceae bacterium]|nr:hypothetical protein [Chitinophagaceae bacterium]
MPFYKNYKPPATLDSLVRELQVYHVKWGEEENLPEPFITCLANTEQNLYFYPRDPIKVVAAVNMEIPVPAVVITGPKTKPVGLLFGKDHLMIKVAFHPTGTYRLLGINMQKTVNSGLDAKECWGDEVIDIVKELQESASYDLMIHLVFAFIEKRVDGGCRHEEPMDQVARQMLDPLNNYSLEELSSIACLSLRQFERNFITRVGISPKLFLRIVRFEYAMQLKNSNPDIKWSQIGLECGYTDSSHLQRDFKEFAEFPPGKYYLQPTSGYSDFPTA